MPVTVPTNPQFEGGNGAAILIGSRDETRLNNKVEMGDGRELLKRTTFQSPGYAEELSYGILSGTCKFSGYLAPRAAIVSAQMATFIGKNRKPAHVMVAPSGFTVGYETVFCSTKASDFDVDTSFGGITTAASAFATSSSGLIDGACLHTPHGVQAAGGNEIANLVFTNVNPLQYLALRGFGQSGTGAANLFSFRLTDYATDAALCTAIKAGLEALSVYAGRTVTVTVGTARTTTNGLLSLVLKVEWNGGVNVTELEALQGALHILTFVGASGVKTVYDNVAINVSSSTNTSVQTSVQGKGGEFANVSVTKTGAGGTAVYTFAYPIFANPAALVPPTVSTGEKHTINGTGNNPVFYGTVAPNLATATLQTIQDAVRLKSGLSTAVVSGTITRPVNNVLTGGTATATPVGTTAGNAIDGDTSSVATLTNQNDGNNPQNVVLTIDRGAGAADVAVSQVIIDAVANGFSGQADDYVETSADGTNGSWTKITPLFQVAAQVTNPLTVNTNVGAIAKRFVRLVLPTNQGAFSTWQIREFSVVPVNGTPGGLALTIQYDAAAGNVTDIEATPGAGYVGTVTPAGTSADPTTTVSVLTSGSSAGLLPQLTQQGGLSGMTYNVVNASGQDAWVDYGANSSRIEALLSLLSLTGSAASLTVAVDHADDNGSGAPGAVTEAFTFTVQTGAVGDEIKRVMGTTLKRWRRCRWTLTAGATAVFGVAVAY